jgi:hypothetical protein
VGEPLKRNVGLLRRRTEDNKLPEEWPFEDEPRVAVLTTRHVMRDGEPILSVWHDADDGSWQFHYGGPVSVKDAMLVALEEVLEIDPTIASLANLPLGYSATRKDSRSAWRIRKKANED